MHPSDDATRAALDLAVGLAEEAGQLLVEYSTRDLHVETKTTDTDPVSEADEASEELITRGLREAHPDDGILGEEEAATRGESGRWWVIDPLDGTVNYLYGIPAWCVSIAYEDPEGFILGVVHDPNRGETFTATRGGGAFLDGDPIHVNPDVALGHALVATGFAYDPLVRVAQGQLASGLLGAVRDLRRIGAAALDLAWTACGRMDGFYEFGLSRWDWAAGSLLVQEAGGSFSRELLPLAGRERNAVFGGGRAVHDGLVDFVHTHLGVA